MVKAGENSKRINNIQLGFSVTLEDEEHRSYVGHHLPLWRDWDGGQIGGRPSWLQPRDLPQDAVMCKNCEATPMVFICQLYAPADDVNPEAFHRSLYVFGCPSAQCARSTTGAIRVFRTQLPRDNPFYPNNEDKTWAMHLPESWDVELCKVCGQRGKGKCPVQGLYFCCNHHQKEYKKFIFDKQQQLSKQLQFTFLPSVCAESELVVEEEPGIDSDEEEIFDDKAEKALFKSDDDDGNAEDGDLEQKDLNEMVGARDETVSKDPITMEFYSRIGAAPNVQEQCLRYLRWPDDSIQMQNKMPLWISTENRPRPDSIPDCPCCGSERKFEFQIMPQMLHYLLKDHQIQKAKMDLQSSIDSKETTEAIKKAASIMEQAPKEQVPPGFAEAKEKAVTAMRSKLMGENGDKELSWGVVGIYTCSASCGEKDMDESAGLGAYREEFAWKQPSLDYAV